MAIRQSHLPQRVARGLLMLAALTPLLVAGISFRTDLGFDWRHGIIATIARGGFVMLEMPTRFWRRLAVVPILPWSLFLIVGLAPV